MHFNGATEFIHAVSTGGLDKIRARNHSEIQ